MTRTLIEIEKKIRKATTTDGTNREKLKKCIGFAQLFNIFEVGIFYSSPILLAFLWETIRISDDDDDQNSLTSYQKFDRKRINQKQEMIKRAGDLRTRRTPHRTDTPVSDDIKGTANRLLLFAFTLRD
ncbi:unnamed protein product [Rotaria socialis]